MTQSADQEVILCSCGNSGQPSLRPLGFLCGEHLTRVVVPKCGTIVVACYSAHTLDLVTQLSVFLIHSLPCARKG